VGTRAAGWRTREIVRRSSSVVGAPRTSSCSSRETPPAVDGPARSTWSQPLDQRLMGTRLWSMASLGGDQEKSVLDVDDLASSPPARTAPPRRRRQDARSRWLAADGREPCWPSPPGTGAAVERNTWRDHASPRHRCLAPPGMSADSSLAVFVVPVFSSRRLLRGRGRARAKGMVVVRAGGTGRAGELGRAGCRSGGGNRRSTAEASRSCPRSQAAACRRRLMRSDAHENLRWVRGRARLTPRRASTGCGRRWRIAGGRGRPGVVTLAKLLDRTAERLSQLRFVVESMPLRGDAEPGMRDAPCRCRRRHLDSSKPPAHRGDLAAHGARSRPVRQPAGEESEQMSHVVAASWRRLAAGRAESRGLAIHLDSTADRATTALAAEIDEQRRRADALSEQVLRVGSGGRGREGDPRNRPAGLMAILAGELACLIAGRASAYEARLRRAEELGDLDAAGGSASPLNRLELPAAPRQASSSRPPLSRSPASPIGRCTPRRPASCRSDVDARAGGPGQLRWGRWRPRCRRSPTRRRHLDTCESMTSRGTNLRANASVEAARAGEAGRGSPSSPSGCGPRRALVGREG
jgi:hypothetical protein